MEFLNYKGLGLYHELLMNYLHQIDPSGAYLPLAGGEMLGNIDMLDSSIIWDDWDSAIGLLRGQLVITGGEGLVFNGATAEFSGHILPLSGGLNIGSSERLFKDLYITSIFPDTGIFYNDLIDDGRSIITINDSEVLGVTVDEGGHRSFTLGAGDNNDCFVVKSDYFDINCIAGGTNIYGFLSISDSAESSTYGQLSTTEGRLEIYSGTGIHLNGPVSIPANYSIDWEDSEGTTYSLGVGKTPVDEDPVLHTKSCYIETLYADAVGTPSEPTLAVHTGIINLLSDTEASRILLTANRDNILSLVRNKETERFEYSFNIDYISSISQDITIDSDCYFIGDIKSDLTIEATDGFKKTGFTNDYVLLADGGTKLLSEIAAPSARDKFRGFVTNSATLSKDQTRNIDEYWIVGADFTPTFRDSSTQNTSTSDPLYVGDIVYVKQATGRPIENDATFEDVYGIIRYSSLYLPLTGTRDGLPLSGSIVVENWAGKALDAYDALIHLKLSAEEETSIAGAEFPYIPILGYTDSTGQFTYLMDICFVDDDFVLPKISFPHGICPGGEGASVGHPDDPFSAVYADLFIVDSKSTNVLLANGTTIAQSALKGSDNNTTYTFKSGTNGFTVTPSGGTALTVTVTPSITNNITGSGTSGCLAKFNGANTLTSGPKLGSDKTKFLRNDGEWAVPTGTGVTGDYLPLDGGDMSGSICMNSHPIAFDEDAYCQIYEDSGQLWVTSDEGVKLTGSVTSTGSVYAPAFFETSDIRKKNIKSDLSLDKCYELIDKCQTVIYSLKDQTQEQIGMIAQEVELFFPELVNTDREGFKSLAYDRLVVICFKVLKDVIKRLEKLENEL